MDILGKYVHAIEDSLSGLRSNSMLFTPMLKEALLFSFDHLIRCVESVCEYNTLDNEEIEEVIAQFKKYPELAIDRHDLVSAAIIRLLGGEVAEVVPLIFNASSTKKSIEKDERVRKHLSQDNQLAYFCSLSTLLDTRTQLWNNRTTVLAHLVLKINDHLGQPVDENQLEAAVYLHDLGMTFFTDTMIDRILRSQIEKEKDVQIFVHPQIGSQFLANIDGWKEASDIVLQHHERHDGKGYPLKLPGTHISIGAKILALATYFDYLVNERDARKRTLLRAVAEVNSYAGTMFDPDVVEAFNETIRFDYSKRNYLKNH